MRAKVTVVIPTINKKELLAEALKSLEKQTFKDFVVIVVDNASTDGTSDFLTQTFPKVEVIKNKTNRGFVAVNQAIQKADSDFVALLNNDALASENWLEELVKGLEKYPQAGFAASKMLKQDRQTIDSAGDGFSKDLLAGYAFGSGKEDGPEYNKERFCFSASGGAAIYRKEVMEKLKGLDEKFFAYFEDIDFGFRAHYAGYKCIYLPKAVVYHRGGETAKHNSLFHLRLTDRNKMMTVIKNLPLKYFLKKRKATFDLFFWPLIELFKQGPRMIPFFWNRVQVLFWLPFLLIDRQKNLGKKVISDKELEELLV